ncbi:MAG: protein YgfX [Wenzhouxiangella sp.]
MACQQTRVRPSRLAFIFLLCLSSLAGFGFWQLPVATSIKAMLMLVLAIGLMVELWRSWFHPPLAAIACDGDGLQIRRTGQSQWQGCIVTPLFASPWFIALRVFLPASRKTLVLGLFRDQLDEPVYRRLAAVSRSSRALS